MSHSSGGNLIDKVNHPLKIGADINRYLIALFKYLQQNEFNPPHIGEEEYKDIRINKDKYPDWLVGYVGFNLSFGAKFFGGYRRDKAGVRDYQNEAQQNLKAQQNLIKNIKFLCCSYDQIKINPSSIIYCDPPYQGTTKYKSSFDHEQFWQWCRNKKAEGHEIYISEYNAPPDFKCIWQKEIVSSLTQDTGSKKGIEKLFTLE